jgi:hypothetical protein
VCDGRTVSRSIDGGATFQPVGALLCTSNPIGIRIVPNQTSMLELAFLIGSPCGVATILFRAMNHRG